MAASGKFDRSRRGARGRATLAPSVLPRSRKTLGLALAVAVAIAFVGMGLLAAGSATLTAREAAAIAFALAIVLVAVPAAQLMWSGELDMQATLRLTGSGRRSGRRWARASPALAVGFVLAGAGVAAREIAQWLASDGRAAGLPGSVGDGALALAVVAFVVAAQAAFTGRPRWLIPPQAR